jgi:hypothetical protein
MASNYKSQFPQSGVRVLFVRTYPKRKESQSGKPIVEVVETLLKRALRDDNRKVPRRGEEIFNIDPQELFGLIETLGTEDYQYDERRSSERLGKRLLWVITDTVTGTMKLMFAEDYDSVLKKFAESTDPNLLDDRTRLLTRYYIRPVTRNFPAGTAQPTEVPQEPTVEMPDVSADSTPIRVTRGSRIRPRDEDDVFSSPPPQRRGLTIPTGGRIRGGAGILPGPDLPEAPPPQRRRPTATELRDAQPNDMDFSGAPVLGVDLIGQKRMRSLKDIYDDPRSDKRSRPNPPQGTRRRTYREDIERPRENDRSGRDEPGQGPHNPLDWGFY